MGSSYYETLYHRNGKGVVFYQKKQYTKPQKFVSFWGFI